MLFDFDKCRTILLESLASALSTHADLVRSLEEKHRTNWSSGLKAISYDLLPWESFIAISFRAVSDQDPVFQHYPADDTWTGYNLIGQHNANYILAAAIGYLHDVYEKVEEDPKRCQEINHLIFLAAAMALLDPKVAELLRGCNLSASVITDQIPYREFTQFEYVVIDSNRCFKGNYCELIWGARVAKRLLRRDL